MRILFTILLLSFVHGPLAMSQEFANQDLRVGIIGLDTSHAVAFTKIINGDAENGCQVTAAYPIGSKDLKSSVSRRPQYTEQLQSQGIIIVDTIEELLTQVDCILLESNDGRVHLEQALPVIRAGKPMFIDKPVAGSLADTIAIFEAARRQNSPVFTSSSLRFTEGAKKILAGSVGNVVGCDAYSPCVLEQTHPDFFWYGIHGVETLFTIMGPGCESVVRVHAPNTDVAVGTWSDGRIGSFRGRRKPDNGHAGGYGGTVFGDKGVAQIGGFSGYDPLIAEIITFFKTGKPPVSAAESIEIYAFMEAADESKRQAGKPVKLATVMETAERLAMKKLDDLENQR